VVREIFADRDVVQPVARGPCAAVHFQYGGKRAGTLRTVKAREQRRGTRWIRIFEVFGVDGHSNCLGG
jgi:hypothetical protein